VDTGDRRLFSASPERGHRVRCCVWVIAGAAVGETRCAQNQTTASLVPNRPNQGPTEMGVEVKGAGGQGEGKGGASGFLV
jgi:hypothetical protein